MPLVALLATVAPRDARGQACCAVSGADDLAVVTGCAQAVVAGRLGYEAGFGSFDARGRYVGYEDYAVHDLVLTLGAGVRLPVESLQVNAALPVRVQYRRAGDDSGETATGVGDASLSLRWTATQDHGRGLSDGTLLPTLEVFGGVRAPTGRAPEDATSPLAADATGQGAWAAHAGLRLTKSVTPSHAARLEGRYVRAFERTVHRGADAVYYVPGDEIGLGLGWLYVHDLVWSGGLTAELLLIGAPREDGRAVADASGRRLRLGAHVTHAFARPHWDVSLGVAADPWWDDAAVNVPAAGPSVAVTLRHTWH